MDYDHDTDNARLEAFQGKRPRLVSKSGELNINTNNVPKKNRRLLSDLFNTILDIRWRWHLVIFLSSFALSWFFFAFVWYSIAYLHNDLNYEIDDSDSNINITNKMNVKPCVSGVHDFTSALLYSVETQHTIGYGHRHITEECPFAIVFLMLQSCIGIFVQGLVAGVVFAKLSRPNKRKRTIIFSNNAVITYRDEKLCFLFKIGNIRISQLSDARIRLIMIKSRVTKEGEFIPFQSYEMFVGHEWSGRGTIFFPYPKIVEHVINEDSPFHEIFLTKNMASTDDYEIVAILEGNIETTGASCHIRTSYLPEEILWGHRFTPCFPYVNSSGFSFDFSKFNQVEPDNSNLLQLNRNNNYLKILSKISKIEKNYTNSLQLPSFTFLKQCNARSCHNSSDVAKKISLEKIFFQFEATKIRRPVINRKSAVKNGRFTVVPVDEIVKHSDDGVKNVSSIQNEASMDLTDNLNQKNDFTGTSFVHSDEGYLTCKHPEVKKNNGNCFK